MFKSIVELINWKEHLTEGLKKVIGNKDLVNLSLSAVDMSYVHDIPDSRVVKPFGHSNNRNPATICRGISGSISKLYRWGITSSPFISKKSSIS